MTNPRGANPTTQNPVTLLAALVAASLLATACGFQHSSSVLQPDPVGATPSTGSPGTAGPSTALVGTWTSQSLTVPTPSGCSNFQWRVTSQTATSVTGSFEADCAGGVTASGTAQGQLVNGTTVPIVINGTANLLGVTACAFSLSGTGTIQDNGNALQIPYSGTTCLGPLHGTEVLRKATPAAPAPAPPPTPTPVPPPPPPPQSGPSSNDAIDLTQATIMNSPGVASWPATATITLLDLGAGGAHVEFTKRDGPGSWPDVPFGAPGDSLEYTLWIVLNINGHWYASGCVEFWRGLDRNGGPPSQYAQNWYYDPIRWGPMAGHQPAPGEQVGFLVSAGDARNNGASIVQERSNVVMVPFPTDGGAIYTFGLSRTLGLTRRR